MKLIDYKLIIAFLENFEALIKYACDAKDGAFETAKAQLISYLENKVKDEEERLKLYKDEIFYKKLINFYNATLDLVK